jgi:hypothetical protein
MTTQGERRACQFADMGWSPRGAGCVHGARSVLGGGDAESNKSKLYAKLDRERSLYSPQVADSGALAMINLSRVLGDFRRYLAKADMRSTLTLLLGSALFVAGCSSENPSSSAVQGPSNTEGSGASTVNSVGGTESAAVASSPKHEAVIVVNAAKKGDSGPSCSSDMAAKGKSKCGPASSLTELSWEFTEHRDGADYYKFNWNLTSDGEPKNSQGLTVGFNGDTEITVIDAEHYILIRKGPLNPEPEDAE